MDTSVSSEKIREICERAARYRRQVVAGRVEPHVLEYEIISQSIHRQIVVGPNGLAEVGIVLDAWLNLRLRVFWNPLTDEVKMERPPPERVFALPSSPAMVGDPLYPMNFQSPARYKRPYVAVEGFVYTFEGRDYSPRETEAMTARMGTIKGWTWRAVPDD